MEPPHKRLFGTWKIHWAAGKGGSYSMSGLLWIEKSLFFPGTCFSEWHEGIFVSCNFSRETFSEADFAEKCLKIIEEFRFPRQMLVLELTESISEVNSGQIYRNMTRLREEGIHMMLDDFGEGFATFSDLQKYPVTGVKLAKSLVDHIKEEKGRAILQAVVTVGHSMKLLVLAEGVENDQQLQLLKRWGVTPFRGIFSTIPFRSGRLRSL